MDAIVLADLHFGAISPKRFMKELDHCLFTKLNHLKKLDLFLIAGDLFDMREYSSSDTFRTVLHFLNKVIFLTEKTNTKIIVIKGTRNHDDLQLYTLETIYKDCERMQFVHSVKEDEIKGCSILYIPEEYVVDQSIYYKEYFNKHYDLMFGHGIIDKIWYAKGATRDNMSSAPVFNVEELCKVANYCYFGHIHEHKSYGKNKRFKYVGPVTVWEYDKNDHGYYLIHYDKESEIVMEEYISNENAQILRTVPIIVNDDMTIDAFMKLVQSVLNRDDYDGLKLVIRIRSSSPIYLQAKNFVITKVGLYEKVTLSFITEDEDLEETEEEKRDKEKTEELHQTIFTTELNDDVTISEFIKKKEGKNISLDRIREVCGIQNHTINE